MHRAVENDSKLHYLKVLRRRKNDEESLKGISRLSIDEIVMNCRSAATGH